MPAQAARATANNAHVSIAEKKEIVRAHLYGWVDKGAVYAEKRAKNLYGGAFGFILNPAAGVLIKALAIPEMKKSSRQALDVVIDCACEGTDKKTIDKWFEKFLYHNDIYKRVNKSHKKHNAVVRLTKKTFIAQVESAAMLFGADGNNYKELVRDAYPTKDYPDKLLVQQYKCADAVIRMDEKYPGLIKIPKALRKEARIITRFTLMVVRDGMREELNEFYPESSWEKIINPASAAAKAGANAR